MALFALICALLLAQFYPLPAANPAWQAQQRLTDWALDSQGIGRVEVLVATGNAASLATARKARFIQEGTLRRAGYVHDGKADLIIFSRLDDDPRPQF